MTSSKKLYIIYYPLSVFLFMVFLISCSEKKEDVTETITDTTALTQEETPESPGKSLFYLRSDENNISCADCHSDGTNTDRPLTAFFSDVKGASERESTYHGMFKGEEVKKNAGGATICWETYLRKKSKLTEEQINHLNDYYKMIAGDEPVSVKEYETIALPERDKKKLRDVQKDVGLLNGDIVNGEKVFNDGCIFCHGENSQIKKVPDILEDFEGNVRSVTYMIRLGDAAMPFFHQGALSDQEIADVAAFLMGKK
jgi:mono/diheme cytochrome c family protein